MNHDKRRPAWQRVFFDQDVVTPRDAAAMDAAHARLAREDAQRARWLSAAIRIGGHCHACGRELHDRTLVAHPGVCGRCLERGRAQPIRLDLEVVR